MKKKPIRKMRLGKWKADSHNGILWHIFYDKTHYARLFLEGKKRIEFRKDVPVRKLYYLNRFIKIVVNAAS